MLGRNQTCLRTRARTAPSLRGAVTLTPIGPLQVGRPDNHARARASASPRDHFGSTNAPGGTGPFGTTSSNVIVFVSPLANVIRMVLSSIDS